MTPEELAGIVANPRLSNEAVRLILFVAANPGAHEIEGEELRILLGCSSDTPVQNARKRAVKEGLIEWRQGGRGHANVYTYLPPKTRVSDIPMQQDTGKGDVVEGGMKIIPPSPPSTGSLAEKAIQAIQAAGPRLEGCRGAFRDYLHDRVPERRQYAYVQTVMSWLDNPKQAFMQQSGQPVPPADCVKLLAVALNELAATDEVGMQAPVGDVRNLKSKLYWLSLGFGRKPKANARASPRGKPSDYSDVGEGTPKFNGLNG